VRLLSLRNEKIIKIIAGVQKMVPFLREMNGFLIALKPVIASKKQENKTPSTSAGSVRKMLSFLREMNEFLFALKPVVTAKKQQENSSSSIVLRNKIFENLSDIKTSIIDAKLIMKNRDAERINIANQMMQNSSKCAKIRRDLKELVNPLKYLSTSLTNLKLHSTSNYRGSNF
jgi:hypothetical protein